MNRTARMLLRPTGEQSKLLAETSELFTAAFDEVCRVGWAQRTRNGVTLHHATYRALKAAYPALVSDLHIQARAKAAEAVASALARQRNGRKVSQPGSGWC